MSPPALHVDVKAVTPADLARRADALALLRERDGRITHALASSQVDTQWMKDRKAPTAALENALDLHLEPALGAWLACAQGTATCSSTAAPDSVAQRARR